MSTTIVTEEAEKETGFGLGGGFGYLLRFGATVAVGCALFAASRKMTWGVDEPMLDWRLWAFALAPYFLFVLASSISLGHARIHGFIKSTQLPEIWTASLALYVVVHATGLSRLIEDPIYDSLSLSPASFVLLTVVYVTASFGLLSAFTPLRLASLDRKGGHVDCKRPNPLSIGYALCLPLFLFFVFYIPLQS